MRFKRSPSGRHKGDEELHVAWSARCQAALNVRPVELVSARGYSGLVRWAAEQVEHQHTVLAASEAHRRGPWRRHGDCHVRTALNTKLKGFNELNSVH